MIDNVSCKFTYDAVFTELFKGMCCLMFGFVCKHAEYEQMMLCLFLCFSLHLPSKLYNCYMLYVLKVEHGVATFLLHKYNEKVQRYLGS